MWFSSGTCYSTTALTECACVRVHECMLDSELTAVYLEIIKHMFCVVSSVTACSFIPCSAVQMA